MSSSKRKFDIFKDHLIPKFEHIDLVDNTANSDSILLPPTKRRKMVDSLLPEIDVEPAQNPNVVTRMITAAMNKLTFSPLIVQHNNSTYQKSQLANSIISDPETSGGVSANQQQSTCTDQSSAECSTMIPVLYLKTKMQPFVLVKPSFAEGGFAECSIWLGLDDCKLYVRKLQVSTTAPRDINYGISHPNVPALVTSIDHGKCPDLNWWSTMHEYVHGLTLLDLFDFARANNYRFPEPVIWQCGATLLDVVRTMLFPDESDECGCKAIWHNDIYPRNILVSDNGEENSSTTFHLIDFGMATKGPENIEETPTDLYCISNILHCLMLGRIIGSAARSEVRQSCHGYGWPYSRMLEVWVEQVHEAGLRALAGTPPNRQWFDSIINDFRWHARRSTRAAKISGTEYKISLDVPILGSQPWRLRTEDAEEDVETMLIDEFGCFPSQIAKIDSRSLEVVNVEDRILWARRKFWYRRRDGN